mmetsp:Transcript_4047/g.11614  ORF Transcript_4047/g.11614 Transcript_4047/m.11614 type:complete len:259 (-) Transcript_4047:67-843(-)
MPPHHWKSADCLPCAARTSLRASRTPGTIPRLHGRWPADAAAAPCFAGCHHPGFVPTHLTTALSRYPGTPAPATPGTQPSPAATSDPAAGEAHSRAAPGASHGTIQSSPSSTLQRFGPPPTCTRAARCAPPSSSGAGGRARSSRPSPTGTFSKPARPQAAPPAHELRTAPPPCAHSPQARHGPPERSGRWISKASHSRQTGETPAIRRPSPRDEATPTHPRPQAPLRPSPGPGANKNCSFLSFFLPRRRGRGITTPRW